MSTEHCPTCGEQSHGHPDLVHIRGECDDGCPYCQMERLGILLRKATAALEHLEYCHDAWPILAELREAGYGQEAGQ